MFSYRYGMNLRPLSIGSVPSGFVGTAKNENFRHGEITYPCKLSEKLAWQFDLTPIRCAEEVPELIRYISDQMGDYVKNYLTDRELFDDFVNIQEHREKIGFIGELPDLFSMMVQWHQEKLTGFNSEAVEARKESNEG